MVKRTEYNINAMTVNGAHFTLVKGLENEEDAKVLLAKIMERITQRRGRYVSLGDVVFDPMPVVAYSVREWDVWECNEDASECPCDDEEDVKDMVEVIDLNPSAEPPAEGGEF